MRLALLVVSVDGTHRAKLVTPIGSGLDASRGTRGGGAVDNAEEEQDHPSWCFLRFRKLPAETINAIRLAMAISDGTIDLMIHL